MALSCTTQQDRAGGLLTCSWQLALCLSDPLTRLTVDDSSEKGTARERTQHRDKSQPIHVAPRIVVTSDCERRRTGKEPYRPFNHRTLRESSGMRPGLRGRSSAESRLPQSARFGKCKSTERGVRREARWRPHCTSLHNSSFQTYRDLNVWTRDGSGLLAKRHLCAPPDSPSYLCLRNSRVGYSGVQIFLVTLANLTAPTTRTLIRASRRRVGVQN